MKKKMGKRPAGKPNPNSIRSAFAATARTPEFVAIARPTGHIYRNANHAFTALRRSTDRHHQPGILHNAIRTTVANLPKRCHDVCEDNRGARNPVRSALVLFVLTPARPATSAAGRSLTDDQTSTPKPPHHISISAGQPAGVCRGVTCGKSETETDPLQPSNHPQAGCEKIDRLMPAFSAPSSTRNHALRWLPRNTPRAADPDASDYVNYSDQVVLLSPAPALAPNVAFDLRLVAFGNLGFVIPSL